MSQHLEMAELRPRIERKKVGIDQKVLESSELLLNNFADGNFSVAQDLDKENFRLGIIPRISKYDIPYLKGLENVKLVEVPDELREKLQNERSEDLIRWNTPDRFLHRLRMEQTPFKAPILGRSPAMDRIKSEKRVVSFDNLRLDSPVANDSRKSRSALENTLEINLMGHARIPFALGSVPDVGSFLAYTTVAMAGGMVFISRDKLLSDIDQQAALTKEVIDYLKNVDLPSELYPNDKQLTEFAEITKTRTTNNEILMKKYIDSLRNSWIANVGFAVESESKNALKRTEANIKAGARMARVYSPEGGKEIPDTTKDLRKNYEGMEDLKIVSGQIMDYDTAARTEDAGADSEIGGVAGGSQCTTSVNADIAVKTPNLLYDLRGTIGIPFGVEGGGVGTHLMTAFALGLSFVSKAGEIGVSSEGAGGRYLFRDEKGDFWMLYGGEASVSAKWWKDSIDNVGRPMFVEGETGVRRIYHKDDEPSKRNISMTGNLVRLRNMLSIGLVFQRADSIAELHQRSCENVVEVTSEASALSQAYAK